MEIFCSTAPVMSSVTYLFSAHSAHNCGVANCLVCKPFLLIRGNEDSGNGGNFGCLQWRCQDESIAALQRSILGYESQRSPKVFH